MASAILPSPLRLADLARARGIPADLLRRLGWQERPDGVAVPWPRTEESVALHVRHHLDGDPDGEPRWTWEAYDRDTLLPYGADRLQDWLDRGHRTVVVAESEVDAVACWKSGVPAVATGGASGWQPRWWSVLRGFDRIVIWLEDAGSCQLLRALVATRPADGPELAVAHNLPGPKDPGRILAEDRVRGPGRVLRAVQAARPVQAVADLLQAVVSHLQARPSGRGYSARCPFHEDRVPSMSLFPGEDGWRWRCHAASCGLSGRLELLGAVLGLVAVEALGRPDRNRSAGIKGGDRPNESNGFVTAADLLGEAGVQVEWCWRGYLPRGGVALLSSLPKTGKTVLIFHLLRAVLGGEAEFLGLRVNLPDGARAALLTEEPEALVVSRLRALGLDSDRLLVAFKHRSQGRSLQDLVREALDRGAALIVVDTLAAWAGLDDENDAARVEAVLRPVVSLVQERGAALLLSHHLRKAAGADGTAHRGSGHLVALVDVAVELRRPEGGNAPLNRRVLRAVSRFSETPEELVVELRPDGYRSLGGSQDVARQELRQAILDVLPGLGEDPIPLEARGGESVLARLKGQTVPRTTAYEVLTRLVEDGAVERTGTGKRGDPYKYRVASPGDPGQDSFGRSLRVGDRPNESGTYPPGPDSFRRSPGGSTERIRGSALEEGVAPGGHTVSGQDFVPSNPHPYTTERKPAPDRHPAFPGPGREHVNPDPQTPGACPDPGVDLLEGADLLATLGEDLPEEDPGPPPDLDRVPPAPDGVLEPTEEGRGLLLTAYPIGGSGIPQAPRTCIDRGAPLPPDNLVRCEPCVARAWQEVWGEPPPPKQQRGPALPDATRLALGRGEVLP
ncbi:MAG: AAA family ATPase [Armatimonadota bacterium]|nr:AAA family ATPase [Armatimonadota bacterium]